MPTGLFITGTDTGVGKTFVATALVRGLAAEGVRVAVRKPVESGCEPSAHGPHPRDAEALRRAAGGQERLEVVCPFRLTAPLSPERAARLEGRRITLEALVAACSHSRGEFDVMVIEGAGGFYSPIAEGLLNADLAVAVGYPVLLVCPDRLGAIHQALVTAEAIRHRNLQLAGVILNDVTGAANTDMDNAADLEQWLGQPVVTMPHDRSAGVERAPADAVALRSIVRQLAELSRPAAI